jgi:hypothetical protein
LLGAGLTLGGCAIGAGAAEAGDAFERGFQDELGRITAHEAVHLGRAVLGEVLLVDHDHGYRGSYGYRPIPCGGYWTGSREHRHHYHHHHKHKHKHHAHHHDDGPPWGYAWGYRARHDHHGHHRAGRHHYRGWSD